jgi:16S rRNA (cytidine1402-2'-O)-methyltransferase
MAGLVLVPTPIGNLKDITLRAIEILENADKILAEDTRITGRLLKHLGIEKKMQSYHQANEHRIIDNIIEQLLSGQKIVLVTDAGTPAISDPGFLLVRACIENGIHVECLPGPTAFVPALAISGFPTEKFVFEGFLPHKKGRQTRLKLLAEEERTVILYESPHRLLKTLGQIGEYFDDNRRLSISREISKMYEETIRGDAGHCLNYFTDKGVKGEFVIVIEGMKKNRKEKYLE